MGYVRDHAIVVVGTYDNWVAKAHATATEIFPWVSPICPRQSNGSQSFFVPPDGSKEGWEESIVGDSRRDVFVAWLLAQRYEDGSSPLQWVEVRVSDDDHDLVIERSHHDVA